MKINGDYFYLTSPLGRFKYFLKQGNLFNHLRDRFKWHILPKYKIVPKFPTHVDIEVSSLCQLRCPMCTQTIMGKNLKGNMDFELFKKIINECIKGDVYSIKLSWRGEPLLNPKLWDMVRYAKKKGIKNVAFLSNGERLKKSDINEIFNSGVDWISFSIDGLYSTYEKIRYPSKFKTITKNLKLIKEAKKKLGAKKPLIRVQTIYSAIEKNPQEYYDYWKNIVDRVNFIADEDRADKQRDFQQDPNYICASPWQRMVVAQDGTVMLCVCDYFMGNIIGNVKNESLSKIWKSKNANKIRYLMKNGRRLEMRSCKKCCHGGLTQEIDVKFGDKTKKIIRYIDQEKGVKKS